MPRHSYYDEDEMKYERRDWTLVAHGDGAAHYLSEHHGRWFLQFRTPRRSGPEGDLRGYATRGLALEAAYRYCTP